MTIQVVASDGTTHTETGWFDGGPITARGNRATISSVKLTCSCDDGPGGGGDECETAFSYSSDATGFFDIDEDGNGDPDFKRWEWTHGPLVESSGGGSPTRFGRPRDSWFTKACASPAWSSRSSKRTRVAGCWPARSLSGTSRP